MARSHGERAPCVFLYHRGRREPGKVSASTSETMRSDIRSFSQAYSPADAIFSGFGVLLSVCPFSHSLSLVAIVTAQLPQLQAVKDVGASGDTLDDLFERIEGFFRRLEAYIELPSIVGMSDTIVKIMAEMLSILGIATKEMKQSKASESTSLPRRSTMSPCLPSPQKSLLGGSRERRTSTMRCGGSRNCHKRKVGWQQRKA